MKASVLLTILSIAAFPLGITAQNPGEPRLIRLPSDNKMNYPSQNPENGGYPASSRKVISVCGGSRVYDETKYIPAFNEANRRLKMKEFAHVCISLTRCFKFPSILNDPSLGLPAGRTYWLFPILTSGELYRRGFPGWDRVVVDDLGKRVVLVSMGATGWKACPKYDYNSQRPTTAMGRIRNSFHYWTGGRFLPKAVPSAETAGDKQKPDAAGVSGLSRGFERTTGGTD